MPKTLQYSVTTWKNRADTPPHDETRVFYGATDAYNYIDNLKKDNKEFTAKWREIKLGPWQDA